MVGGATGLIPSQFLEEKRKAFVPRDFDGAGVWTRGLSQCEFGVECVHLCAELLNDVVEVVVKWADPAPLWPKAETAPSNERLFFLGILCGTLAGKKKKKMMYLTAKNAGQNSPPCGGFKAGFWVLIMLHLNRV